MYRPELAKSHMAYAERLKKGHGYYEGNKIVSNPVKCKEKANEHMKLAVFYSTE